MTGKTNSRYHPYARAVTKGVIGAYRAAQLMGRRKEPLNKRRKTNGSAFMAAGDALEYRRSKLNFGRYKYGQRKINALVKSNIERSYWRYSVLTPFDTAGASFAIGTNRQGIAGTAANLPLYLFDLTAFTNLENGALVAAPCPWRLTVASDNAGGAAGQYRFFSPTGKADGTAIGTTWAGENLPNTAALSYPLRRIMCNFIQGKLLMYGALTRATKFKVEIIKLKRDYLHPDYNTTGSVVAGTPVNANDNWLAQRDAFWQSMVQPYMSTPLNIQDPEMRKLYKVVKQIGTFVIEPKLSTEPTANATTWPNTGGNPIGHIHQHDWFFKMDQVFRYDWGDQTVLATGQSLIGDVDFQQNINPCHPTVKPSSRMYLMIRAVAPTNDPTNYPGYLNTITPAFDIFLRKKMTQLA